MGRQLLVRQGRRCGRRQAAPLRGRGTAGDVPPGSEDGASVQRGARVVLHAVRQQRQWRGGRRVGSVGPALHPRMITLSRRRLLQGIAAAIAIAPLWEAEARAADLDAARSTMEAWTDTIVPGEKRSPSDRAIAGATPGPGAVQAGSWELMNDPDVGLAPLLPALAAGLNAQAASYAAGKGIALEPTVPPFVALAFDDRTALAEKLLDGSG